MKCVKKLAEPEVFVGWKGKISEEWEPSYETLQNPEKQALHQALLIEQAHVCCYCGRTISLQDSHIEHFRPQNTYANLALAYENLHASCIRETATGSPLHCGHAKGRCFDEGCIISPLDEDCERRFIYSSQDGAIYPAHRSDASAKYMVDLLKLNVRFLSNRRSEVLKMVFDEGFLESVSDDELIQLANAYRSPDPMGKLTNFGHVLSRFAEQLLGRPIEVG